jgi:amidophosphoribosyltransferase
MIAGYGLLAFRDPHGIRPLVVGEMKTQEGAEYLVASESVALDTLGFELVRDVEPGEAIFIDQDGNFYSRQCAANPQHNPCIFEFVYLARPDSVIDGISVYETRMRMGRSLADKIRRDHRDLEIDVVIPIPDSSRPSAMELAEKLGLPYREGFIKNRYIGRTFIMPGQELRKKSVRQKLNAMAVEFKDKNVLLVDDSIVRGTTSREIVQMARECGAKKVFFASAAPPVRFPNVYGIDMPTRSELIATGRDEAQIAEAIGADAVLYQDLASLIADVRACNPAIERFDCSCFDGDYITGDVSPDYLAGIEASRHDGESSGTRLSSYQLDLGLTAVD